MEKIDTSPISDWPEDVVLGSTVISDEGSSHILSSQEKDELSSFKSLNRKAEYISARSLFRFLLFEMNLDNQGIELLKEAGGKPYAKSQDKTIYVSFSHSPSKVFCAISETFDIGLDVELSNREVNDAVVNRILNNKEHHLADEEEPIRLWTIKEAAVKCLGTGLRTNLDDLTIQKNEKNRFSVRFNNDKMFEICSFTQTDHQIALAYQSKNS